MGERSASPEGDNNAPPFFSPHLSARPPSMDAFGGVVNTLQFIEFACKLVRLGKELYNNGALPENLHLEDVTSQLRDFNAQLKTSIKGKAPQSTAWTGQDKVSLVPIK